MLCGEQGAMELSRELFIDAHLVRKAKGVRLVCHSPVSRGRQTPTGRRRGRAARSVRRPAGSDTERGARPLRHPPPAASDVFLPRYMGEVAASWASAAAIQSASA